MTTPVTRDETEKTAAGGVEGGSSPLRAGSLSLHDLHRSEGDGGGEGEGEESRPLLAVETTTETTATVPTQTQNTPTNIPQHRSGSYVDLMNLLPAGKRSHSIVNTPATMGRLRASWGLPGGGDESSSPRKDAHPPSSPSRRRKTAAAQSSPASSPLLARGGVGARGGEDEGGSRGGMGFLPAPAPLYYYGSTAIKKKKRPEASVDDVEGASHDVEGDGGLPAGTRDAGGGGLYDGPVLSPSSSVTGSTEEDEVKPSSPWYVRAAGQIPAVALIAVFHLMIGIPFGVSYFPIGWRSEETTTGDGDGEEGGEEEDLVNGTFPLPGKEALGIRMFLFSTVVGQMVFTYASKFDNVIGLQMVENVPFCHSLAYIVIAEQGFGMDALSTVFFLFGFASVVVGAIFYVLGRFQLGRVVYFFPSHVLVGCIGGIGLFIAITGIEVTIDATITLTAQGIGIFVERFNLLAVVIFFEILLRLLTHATKDAGGKPRFPLLSPIYFCMISPAFYLGMWVFRVDAERARDAGYFFPPLVEESSSVDGGGSGGFFASIFRDKNLWAIWTVIDLSSVSWTAVLKSGPTLVALVLFSLIHVPINIPAFAISTNVDADMNAELIAHGYSNALAGICGGLQNYMAYTQSVLYANSGGFGKASSLAVSAVTAGLFFIGPTIASYIPRCMAGTVLLHVGVDIFLEGVYDSYGKFDYLEYSGIWLITIVMTAYGMGAALVAGVIAALSTYAFQSITYLDPIRGSMSAATLRSSALRRSPKANAILDDDIIGRKKIFVIQLQGHLFFGNVASLGDKVKKLLAEKQENSEEPWIVIMDFSLVLGIDSSAAQAITKLKREMRKRFHVDLCIFVTGSDEGFPTDYALSSELIGPDTGTVEGPARPVAPDGVNGDMDSSSLLQVPNRSKGITYRPVSLPTGSVSFEVAKARQCPRSHVCESLDAALMFAEDVLIARQDPTLLDDDLMASALTNGAANGSCSLSEEREYALKMLCRLCPGEDVYEVTQLFSLFEREAYAENDVLWRQGSPSDCAKLLVNGALISVLEDEAGTCEHISTGSLFGEFGLVQGKNRMSTVRCLSKQAVVYSLSRASWEELIRSSPKIARFVDQIVIRYLAHRVQHVSNRIFETRCLPI